MIQVELHDRANNSLGILSGARLGSMYLQLNNDGVGSFQIHRTDADAIRLNILQGGIDGFIVHLLRKGPLEAAFTDRFSFVVEGLTLGVDDQEDYGAWITVSGRGTLCLLEDRIAFPPGFDGVSPATITSQWQIYSATAAGNVMSGEIDRSNSRFALALTHTINQATALQYLNLRFDNLRKLHDLLVQNAPMDAQMAGVDYQSFNQLGSDRSANVSMQLGPQDSLLAVQLERDARNVKNWVIAQGTGEGINAPLAIASDATSIANLRRREGFIDDRSVSNATQLAGDASGALAQLKAVDQRITIKYFDSSHTQVFHDFGLGDTVGLAVALLSWLKKYRVVGIQISDNENEIETVSLDLNSMRMEHLLRLNKTAVQPNSSSLSTLNRSPQGGPFNDSFDYDDNCNPSFPFHFVVFVPSNVLKLNYGKLSFFLQAFRTYNTFSSSVTGAESGHIHSHSHRMFNWNSNGAAPTSSSDWTDANAFHVSFASTANPPTHLDSGADATSSSGHTHPLSISSVLGIFEGATATGVLVSINGIDRTVALGGGTGFTSDQIELEISQWLNVGQKNTVDLTPSGLGRIVGHLRLTGYIQSA